MTDAEDKRLGSRVASSRLWRVAMRIGLVELREAVRVAMDEAPNKARSRKVLMRERDLVLDRDHPGAGSGWLVHALESRFREVVTTCRACGNRRT